MIELLTSLQPFWIWLALACLFLAMEVLIVPFGFFLCLGTAAGIMAGVMFFFPSISWLWGLTLYSMLMVVACWVWWRVIRGKRVKSSVEEEDDGTVNVKTRQLIGYKAVLSEDIKAGRGRIRVNDSPWPVEADIDYPAGTKVEVTEVRGITLKVQAVSEPSA